jgi:LacI family transcriptional regulator
LSMSGTANIAPLKNPFLQVASIYPNEAYIVFAILRGVFMILRMKKSSHDISSTRHPTAVIGLVMDFFNPRLLEGARAYAEEHNLRLDARWSVRGDWLPNEVPWDGLLHGIVDNPALLRRLKKLSIPAVGLVAGTADPCVVPDYKACGRLAIEELVRCGIAHLLLYPELAANRLDLGFNQGVCAAALREGISVSPFDSYSGKSYHEIIAMAVRKIISLPKPLGIALPHAGWAYSLVNALLQNDLRIPEDVALVVVDKDVQQTAALAPVPLSSVELNEWHRGFVAAETLHQLLLGSEPQHRLLELPPTGIHGRASTGHADTRDPIMGKALTYLRKHFREGIGVPEVVAAAGASRRAVEMHFRETLNCGIHEELNRLRMEDAKHLLLEGQLSATAIAQVCGFSSIHYFSAAFKRDTGISPRQFQKAATPSNENARPAGGIGVHLS